MMILSSCKVICVALILFSFSTDRRPKPISLDLGEPPFPNSVVYRSPRFNKMQTKLEPIMVTEKQSKKAESEAFTSSKRYSDPIPTKIPHLEETKRRKSTGLVNAYFEEISNEVNPQEENRQHQERKRNKIPFLF